MTAPTPGTPATTWPTDDELVEVDRIQVIGSRTLGILTAQVAAREAAAHARGRDEGRHEVAMDAQTIMCLFGEVSDLKAGIDARDGEIARLRAEASRS